MEEQGPGSGGRRGEEQGGRRSRGGPDRGEQGWGLSSPASSARGVLLGRKKIRPGPFFIFFIFFSQVAFILIFLVWAATI
jgi:hypothetical protein